MKFKSFIFIILSFFLLSNGLSQKPKEYNSAEIFEAIKKLQFLGSVLYVAAHPDDENTRLISYLSNHVKANTGYLSLTRGDGGQNRIGPEIRELLGVIRTQELLMAREIDGGKQYFTRANDFGYSKHPDETHNIWGKDNILSDVVWVMRNFKPDVIINRFDHRSPGRGHGHHTSSAILSVEAFDLIGNASAYSDQLNYVETWKAKRLFFNTSWWFYGSREAFAEADKSNMLDVDVGVYYPLKGKSNNEIAAESRTMHKSQGFGSTGTRGSQMEYLELIKGDLPQNEEDLFDGINTTWTRVEGGLVVKNMLGVIENEFDFENPGKSVNNLLKVRQLISNIKNEYWKKIKLEEVDKIIQSCMGLYIEAVASDYSSIPGTSLDFKLELTNRSTTPAKLLNVSYGACTTRDSILNIELPSNEAKFVDLTLEIDPDCDFSDPYWLKQEGTLGLYSVDKQQEIGVPRFTNSASFQASIEIAGIVLDYQKPIVHRKNDAVKGAVYHPFEIVPAVSVEIQDDVYIFPENNPRRIHAIVKANADNVDGKIFIEMDDGWKITPTFENFSLAQKGASQVFEFELRPSPIANPSQIHPIAQVNNRKYNQRVIEIEYDHIPVQTVLMDGASKAVNIDIKKAGNRVIYITGSGDAMPECLRQIGYDVTEIEADQISQSLLTSYDACIVGIRAFNLKDELKFKQPILMDYVEQGGTLIVQYNTSRGVVVDNIGPYPMKLSRDRVTVEEAEMRILEKEHPVLNYPNKITSEDFDGWVQERGLYFPNEWDEAYKAILSSNDPGEPPRNGGLLVAQHGQGYFVYTGYSWFRQLPAGVPGAYRLFANMISLGNPIRP